MAVAVKNKSETKTSTAARQLPVNIVLGVLFVVGVLGIVFPLLDAVWWTWLGMPRALGWAWAGRIVASAVVAGVLLYFGWRLLGPEPMRGLFAGISFGFIGFLAVALLTQWFGTILESWVYDWTWLGDIGIPRWWVGVILTALVGGVLLAGLLWIIFNRTAEKAFIGIEDQGWYSTAAYKPNQGQKVRRGTMLALMIIFGTGILALMSSLETMGDWTVNIPFTGKIELTPGNVGQDPALRQVVDGWQSDRNKWESDRQQALSDLDPVFSVLAGLPSEEDRKKELAAGGKLAKLSDLAVVSPEVARKLKDLTPGKRPLGEATPESILADFDKNFASIKEALTKPEPTLAPIDRFAARDINDKLKKNNFWVTRESRDLGPQEVEGIAILDDWKAIPANTMLTKEQFDTISKNRTERRNGLPEQEKDRVDLLVLDGETPNVTRDVPGVQSMVRLGLTDVNMLSYFNVTVLPTLKFSAPIILAILSLWFAWRIVNMPSFSDFLIATEAELNKVSWTTQKRLIQDTIVVLVTVVALAIFLFAADMLWSWVLNLIGVLQSGAAATKSTTQPW
jgi:preprotein translocase SecE subunit